MGLSCCATKVYTFLLLFLRSLVVISCSKESVKLLSFHDMYTFHAAALASFTSTLHISFLSQNMNATRALTRRTLLPWSVHFRFELHIQFHVILYDEHRGVRAYDWYRRTKRTNDTLNRFRWVKKCNSDYARLWQFPRNSFRRTWCPKWLKLAMVVNILVHQQTLGWMVYKLQCTKVDSIHSYKHWRYAVINTRRYPQAYAG